MKRRVFVLGMLSVVVLLTAPTSSQVAVISQPGTIIGSVELIANGVGSLLDRDIFTVPAGRRFKITDLIIGNPNAAANCCARIFTGPGASVDRTAFITVPANDSVAHGFLNGINFNAGQIVNVRNGASSGDLHFTVRGYLFTVP
jgi:hypothetical protein